MNIGDIRKLIAAYASPNKATADFLVGSVDLLMQALNNARTEVEMLVDFNLSKTWVDFSVDRYSGCGLDDGYLHGTLENIAVKSIIDGGFLVDGKVVPAEIIELDQHITDIRQIRDLRGGRRYSRGDAIPADYPAAEDWCRDRKLILAGEQIFSYPGELVAGTKDTAVLYVNRWLGEYTNDNDEDFLTNYGHNYLMWSGICEVNYLTERFVPRQEGSLTAPENQRARALEALQRWDSFQVATGRTRIF
jgi:hypothetical protein